MLISHKVGPVMLGKEVGSERGFLLGNNKGDFLSLGIDSRYRGLYCKFGEEPLKIIDDIRINEKIWEIRNEFCKIVRVRDETEESFFMPDNFHALVYSLKKKTTIEFLFDIRKAYDSREWGRHHSVYEENGKIILEYTKMTDSREDSSNGEKEFTVYAAIDINKGHFEIMDEWVREEYSFDKERNSCPFERHVYKCLRVESDRIVVAVSENKEKAIKSCSKVVNNIKKLSLKKKESLPYISENDKIKVAAMACENALRNLINNGDIYAGLPWFFQYWTRDTFISLKAVMLMNDLKLSKKILLNYMNYLTDDGLLPNRIPGTVTKSMDSIGWYFKRWDEFISMKNKVNEKEKVKKKLKDSINKLFQKYTFNSLAQNGKQETWMDTKDTERDGERIEIQALRIGMYDFMFRLTNEKVYADMREKGVKKTREKFWTGKYLKDGSNDETIRPNIFLAAYAYPKLLSKSEWIKCFDFALPRLWLEWGGLSTVDKESNLFCSESSGEDTRSYHNGDSWYWVNYAAALVLYRTDKKRYKKYIDKIIEAGCDEILFNGFIGCASEVSSASRQESNGCLNQAWSNAMFIELARELEK